ncbi:MAG TPA: NAD(P)/FAD-dependent oxidoreductase [Usitatibacter sp.]|nr:NAD(P)/FAD-dependent oxidoreductase [Usitatibacter sp.]
MTWDALVIGGGPSGSTAAALLARQGRRVALVEKAAFPRRKVCGEYISATTWPILDELGVAETLTARAGPAVQRVGLFARDVSVASSMPGPHEAHAWGRAIGRDILDSTLLSAAIHAGAHVIQPATVESLRREGDDYVIEVSSPGEIPALRAKAVIAAHGSWERGLLTPRVEPRASDLLGFKARFSAADLPDGLMPLVLFPGGYGGLVRTDSNEVSFSCCIRRDALGECRARFNGTAGEALLSHAMAHCRALRETLEAAQREGPWLSAGPIRPGIREIARDGLFRVGNAAGEAHPLVAEGISMAIQSAWLLARCWNRGAVDYPRDWHATFASRIRASSMFASLTVPPMPSRASVAFLERVPAALTIGARWSGKARMPQARAA